MPKAKGERVKRTPEELYAAAIKKAKKTAKQLRNLLEIAEDKAPTDEEKSAAGELAGRAAGVFDDLR